MIEVGSAAIWTFQCYRLLPALRWKEQQVLKGQCFTTIPSKYWLEVTIGRWQLILLLFLLTFLLFYCYYKGAFRSRNLNTETRVRSQCSPYAICRAQIGSCSSCGYQAASLRLLMVGARVRSHGTCCGICGDQSNSVTVLFSSNSVLLLCYCSTIAPYSASSIDAVWRPHSCQLSEISHTKYY
jgi:hypothetical protein